MNYSDDIFEDEDSYVLDMLTEQADKEWQMEMLSKYLMGTPQETFRLNWKHFGLKKALYRELERKCSQLACNDIRTHQNRNVNRGFVVYQSPWYFKWLSKLEFYVRKYI